MRKLTTRALALLLALFILCVPALAEDTDWNFRSERCGFSFSLPSELAGDIVIEEYTAGTRFVYTPGESGWSVDSGAALDKESGDAGVRDLDGVFLFRYAPAGEEWSGQLGTLRVKTPKSAFFSDEYSYYACPIIAVNADSAFVSVMPIGGMDSDNEHMEAYLAAMDRFNTALHGSIKAGGGASVPGLDERRIPDQAAKLSAEPDRELTRGECAELLYELIRPESGEAEPEYPFSDAADASCARAASYLADFGIISGYPDGSFRPEQSVTRAEFVKMLHRSLFIPFPLWYGDPIEFSDVDESHWAWDYLNSACQYGMLAGGGGDMVWLRGYSDGTLRPDASISCGEAAAVILRLADGE